MAKARGGAPVFDEAAIARAEAALKDLSSKFDTWLQDEFANLQTAFQDVKSEGTGGDAGGVFYRRAHDLKGLGSTYEFPLVSQLAGSLCRLIDTDTKRASAPVPLLEAHVAAIHASIRDQVKTADHPVGGALLAELQKRVHDVVGAD